MEGERPALAVDVVDIAGNGGAAAVGPLGGGLGVLADQGSAANDL
jgi:hypothetical protein